MDNKRNLTITTMGSSNSMMKQLAAHIVYYAIIDYQSSVGRYRGEIENEIYSKWFQGVILPILDISIDEFERMLDCNSKSLWIGCNCSPNDVLSYLYKHSVSETAHHFDINENTLRKNINRIGVNLKDVATERQKYLQPTLF